MRIDLAQLGLAGLQLDLARAGHAADRVSVVSAQEVAGTLQQDASGLVLDGVVATRLLLDLLHLSFGTFTLHAQGDTNFERLQAKLTSREAGLEGRVFSEHTVSAQLEISVGALRITGTLAAERLTLELRGSAGQVSAERASFGALVVEAGTLRIACPTLQVEALGIGWGEPAFRLSCSKVSAAQLELASGGLVTHAHDVALLDVRVDQGEVRTGSVRIARIDGNAAFLRPTESAGADAHAAKRTSNPPSVRPPLWDEKLLDGLSGRVSADVEVDLAVPVIGGRHAVHEIRLPIESGTIDYLALEGGLSRLEDALLNFSVRDGALVLELGFPLIGPRGHGKPLLVWDLGPDDGRLAEQNRVRLAVLPHAHTPSQPNAPETKEEAEPSQQGSSGFGLRSLSLENVDTQLSLPPQPMPMNASLQTLAFSSLQLKGSVHHDSDKPGLEPREHDRDGRLYADADNLMVRMRELSVEGHELSLAAQLGRLKDVVLRFEDTHLAQASGVITQIAVDDLKFANA
jgi:hypothetical protein